MRIRTLKITYFVHGTTRDNENDIASGWSNAKLSRLGIEQSLKLKKLIKNKKFDVIFSSDLGRAVTSARLTFGKGANIIEDKRLRECDYGAFTGRDAKEVDILGPKRISREFQNGESYKDVEKRMRSFLKYLFRKYLGKNVAVMSHRGPQLALDVIVKGKTWKQAFKEDWRYKGHNGWKPGWQYRITSTITQ
jgi:alpha-ribazole phosphatase/probable phosphoglycerate mutase